MHSFIRRSFAFALPLAVASIGCIRTEDKPAARDPSPPRPATLAAAGSSADGKSCAGGAAHGDGQFDEDGYSCEHAADEHAGGCNQWDAEAAAVTRRPVPADAHWIAFDVEGMSCGGCERRIIANVGAIDGVAAVEASAELGRVRVAVAPGHEDAADAARRRIGELGYRVK